MAAPRPHSASPTKRSRDPRRPSTAAASTAHLATQHYGATTQLALRLTGTPSRPMPYYTDATSHLAAHRRADEMRDGWRPPVSKDLQGIDPLDMQAMPRLFKDVAPAVKPGPPPPDTASGKFSIAALDDARFKAVAGRHASVTASAGWRHCLFIRDGGTVVGYGSNSHGQLGIGACDGSYCYRSRCSVGFLLTNLACR